LDTETLEKEDWENKLTDFITQNTIKGIVVPGGFGHRGIEGKINIANYCRIHTLPYL